MESNIQTFNHIAGHQMGIGVLGPPIPIQHGKLYKKLGKSEITLYDRGTYWG